MKFLVPLFLILSITNFDSSAQLDTSEVDLEEMMLMLQQNDSLEKTLTYEHGLIDLPGANAQIEVPEGFGYLNPQQAERVLEEFWGNPPSETLGMLVPEDLGVLSYESWAFEITYDEIGYVKDEDAAETNYDDLLKTMQEESVEVNKERVAQGYPEVHLVGWGSKPFYDANSKVLHWAKELKFADADYNTLNYNVRILGRKGVLVANAIATTEQLSIVAQSIPQIMTAVKFKEGYKYADYDSDVDEVAAYTIGGLVAGKVLAKVGVLAFLGKFAKFIFIGLAAVGVAIRGWFKRRKNAAVPAIREYNADNQA